MLVSSDRGKEFCNALMEELWAMLNFLLPDIFEDAVMKRWRLIVASTIHGVPPASLLHDDERQRMAAFVPTALLDA